LDWRKSRSIRLNRSRVETDRPDSLFLQRKSRNITLKSKLGFTLHRLLVSLSICRHCQLQCGKGLPNFRLKLIFTIVPIVWPKILINFSHFSIFNSISLSISMFLIVNLSLINLSLNCWLVGWIKLRKDSWLNCNLITR
jgi:hypothetical protein